MAISKLPEIVPPPSHHRAFLQQVATRLEVDVEATFDRQVRQVLAALGARIPSADARALAHRLPPSLGQAVLGGRQALLAPTRRAFLELLGRQGIPPRLARATIFTVADLLGEQGRAHLRLQPLQPFLDDA